MSLQGRCGWKNMEIKQLSTLNYEWLRFQPESIFFLNFLFISHSFYSSLAVSWPPSLRIGILLQAAFSLIQLFLKSCPLILSFFLSSPIPDQTFPITFLRLAFLESFLTNFHLFSFSYFSFFSIIVYISLVQVELHLTTGEVRLTIVLIF